MTVVVANSRSPAVKSSSTSYRTSETLAERAAASPLVSFVPANGIRQRPRAGTVGRR